VCPTGIDIRNGLQYECIGCAACIDGCDQVMDKMGYQRGLIRYATENALKGHYKTDRILKRVFRPRVLIYTAILWVIIIAAAITLYHRVPLKVDVIRDRGNVMHEAEDANVENVYRLQIMNTQELEREVSIVVSGLEGIKLEGRTERIRIPPTASKLVPVRVEAPRASGHKGSNRIRFTVEAVNPAQPGEPPLVVNEKATFVIN
jgi:cytochrome c oxidase accessory protein FixG